MAMASFNEMVIIALHIAGGRYLKRERLEDIERPQLSKAQEVLAVRRAVDGEKLSGLAATGHDHELATQDPRLNLQADTSGRQLPTPFVDCSQLRLMHTVDRLCTSGGANCSAAESNCSSRSKTVATALIRCHETTQPTCRNH
jgi:hypothetical protein